VFGLEPAIRIYLAVGSTDMRKGFEGLYGLVRDQLGPRPVERTPLPFCNKGRNRLKVLFGTAAVCGFARRETLQNARKGFLRVLYPYHPYYRQTLEVFGAGGGLRDLVYVRMPKTRRAAFLVSPSSRT
jgi:IS66 Orf2 like protein